MTRTASILLRLVGLNRARPTTRFGRMIRRSERVFVVLALAYAGLHVYPQPLFAHSVTDGEVTLYARHPLDARARDRIAYARALVARSELAIPHRRERVFVCDSPWLFRFFAPVHPRSFAISVPITNHIFIATADIEADMAVSQALDHPRRSFSGVVAHEITHGLIRHHLGFWRALRLPDWVAEGYSDTIARSSSFPEDEGRRLLETGQSRESPSFRYYLSRRMVTHLIDDRHLTFDQVVDRAREADAVETETRDAARLPR